MTTQESIARAAGAGTGTRQLRDAEVELSGRVIGGTTIS